MPAEVVKVELFGRDSEPVLCEERGVSNVIARAYHPATCEKNVGVVEMDKCCPGGIRIVRNDVVRC